MALVKFNDPDEFIEELKKERGNIRLNIVRLTNRWTPIPNVAPIRALSVIATAQVTHGITHDIIRLEKYCGNIWDIGEEDKDTYDRAKQIHDKVEKACQELEIEVRAGIVEE